MRLGEVAAGREDSEAVAGAPEPIAAGRRSRFLRPGQLVACAEPTSVTTILGSCVAVCLWDRRLGVGAINHYALPGSADTHEASPRFGGVAMRRMLERLLALGCERSDLEAKLFGGAAIVPQTPAVPQIGRLNVSLARAHLAGTGVPIVAEDVGGRRVRRLVFQTDTGVAQVSEL